MGSRLTIDLTDRADTEIERLKLAIGLPAKDLVRFGLDLLRMYVKAAQDGDTMEIRHSESQTFSVVTFPFDVKGD